MSFATVLRDYGLMWAMVVGALLYPYLSQLTVVLPYTLFAMLFFSYTRVRPSELRVTRLHVVLYLLQWLVAAMAYLMVRSWDEHMAEGLSLIIITPTATSAAVITMMLGGSIAFVTSFLIPCNILFALTIPMVIGYLYPGAGTSYLATTVSVLGQVSFLLLVPLAVVWVLRYGAPRIHDAIARRASYTFYIWMFSIAIITARTIYSFATQDHLDLRYALVSAIMTLLVAVLLYFIGQKSGAYFGGLRVEGRQAFGQKNTVIAIWVALAFMEPEVAIVPSFYVVWQNLLNSIELVIHRREQRHRAA